jgi:hypothetical protein
MSICKGPIKRSMEAGFDFHLVKPADVSQLESLIAAPFPASSHTLSPKRTLQPGAPRRTLSTEASP